MESKNLLTLAITLTVGIILAGSLLMPVISDATVTEKDFENSGYFHMEKYGTDTDVTMSWDPTDPKKITINDVEYSPNTPVNQFVNVAIGDDWYFRYADGGANTYVQVSYGGIDQIAGSNSEGQAVTITCSNGTATITKGTTTQTATYTELYAISGSEGAYIMKNANGSVTVAGDTEFIGLGTTSLGTGKAVLKVTGNVDDGAEVDVIGSTPAEATISDVSVAAITMTGYNGYTLSDVTFTVTMSDVDYPATYNYFIVPAIVTLELSQHLNPGEIAIMNAIPVMIIVALVMMAAGSLYLKRDD